MVKRWRSLLLLVAIATAGCAYGDVSADKARALVANGALLVDVRSPEEYAQGHIEGAVNIPVGEVSARLAELGPKERPVVLYCRSGGRSSRAKNVLKNAGFAEVYNLGAMSRW